jgi:hypothetical protein
MSIRSQAQREMELAAFPPDEREAMTKILDLFLDTWDSGGAVHIACDALVRLIGGQPLTPLTGAEDEWRDVGPWSGEPMWQNVRNSAVFKGADGVARDINVPGRPPITFPYMGPSAGPPDPVMEVQTE